MPREHGVIRRRKVDKSGMGGRGADGAISGPAGNYGSSAGESRNSSTREKKIN